VVNVFELGYSRNVSIRRSISHGVFDSLILFSFLREMLRAGLPCTVFSALPHNGAACVAATVAKAAGARFIVDVHDTWPESLLSVTTLNPVERIGYQAWKGLADFAIVSADVVFAESKSYAKRADTVRLARGLDLAQAIYIGGDLDYYDSAPPASAFPAPARDAKFVVAYAGTLGVNYDLDCVIDAFAIFSGKHPDSALVLLGAGEREDELRARLANATFRAWISGRIPHRTLVGFLKRAHVGLNAFRPGGNVAYSYKLNDYLLCGVPVANSLAGEAADLVSANALGHNYEAGNADSLAESLEQCHAAWQADPEWNRRVTAFARRLLDRRVSYNDLIRACLVGSKRQAGSRSGP
jgi:glycosyltransferase involved in cell wall biosynthesis